MLLNLTAQVTSVRDLAPQIKEIVFQCVEPKDFFFLPGQYVLVDVQDQKIPPVKRAYSLASDPAQKNSFALCVKLVEGGRGSAYLFNLKVNAEVKFLGPAGHFILHNADNSPLLFLGTGTGLAPLKSMLHILASQNTVRPIRLYFGVRYRADIFYRAELENFKKVLPNFSYVLGISRPQADDPPQSDFFERSGRLTEILKTDGIANPAEIESYVCGAKAVTESLCEVLKELGVKEEKIYFEKF
jgi:ferredoxin-NADP reductase